MTNFSSAPQADHAQAGQPDSALRSGSEQQTAQVQPQPPIPSDSTAQVPQAAQAQPQPPIPSDSTAQVPQAAQAQPQPSVSVILPAYNVEPFLRAAMDCVCAQTLRDAEFICVNDGSTDGSLDILQEYAARDPRIRVLDGPNGGYGKAMNRGIDAARGKYIGIYEPDDYIPANMFADLFKTAEKYEAEVVKADYYTFRTLPDGSMQKKRVALTADKSFYNRVLCPGEEFKVFRFRMFTWTGIYRRDFLNEWNIRHSETPGASFQDNGFWFQTFCRAKRLVFSDQAYYHYRQDNPDSSVKSFKKLYCMTEEYRLIENRLKADPDLYEQFKYAFYARKFNAFIYSYRERAIGHRREYLHHMQDELREPFAQGLLREEFMMNRTQWIQLNEIMADPNAYFEHICVSVIMPVHNAAGTLREMLESLLCSWELQYEVICIDAGSSDGSLEILREYETDERVRVYTLPEAKTEAEAEIASDACSASDEHAAADADTDKNENAGIAAAKNLGIRLSEGEYLLFLDPDCRVEPELIRRLHENAHTNLTDITVCRCDFMFDGNSDKAGHGIGTSCAAAAPTVPNARSLAISNSGAGVLLRADFVRGYHLQFDGSQAADELRFLLSAFDPAAKTSVINDVLLHRTVSRKIADTAAKSSHPNPAAFRTDQATVYSNPTPFYTDQAAIHTGPAAAHINPGSFYMDPAGFYTDPESFLLVLNLQQQALQKEKDLQVQAAQLLEIHRADTGELKRLEQVIEKSITAYDKSEKDIRQLTEEKRLLTDERQQLTDKMQKLSSVNQDLQQKLLSTEAARQKTEAALTRTRQSRSYRIGRAITWLPRKIRALLHR